MVPFYVVAPVATVRAMTAVYVAGVTLVKTPTVVGHPDHQRADRSSRSPATPRSSLPRCWWCGRGGGPAQACLAPAPLVGLCLACLAIRLVFEISLLNYYFLAVAVALVLLDFTRRRAAGVVGGVDRGHALRAHPRGPPRPAGR